MTGIEKHVKNIKIMLLTCFSMVVNSLAPFMVTGSLWLGTSVDNYIDLDLGLGSG